MRRDVFQAIADPTRRQILSMLATQPLNANAVAGQFDVSRTAVYKHMKILSECGLVVIVPQGREHYCEARLEKLSEVNEWIEQYKQFWEQRLDSLERYLEDLQTKNKPRKPKAAKKKKK